MFDIYNASNQTVGLMTDDGCTSRIVTTAEKAGKLSACVTIYAMALIGNILIIHVLLKTKSLQRNIHLFILNMAISDLIISVFAIPRRVVEIALEMPSAKWLHSGVTGEITCKLLSFMPDFSGVVSTLTLVLIALERLVAVAFPLRAKMITYRLRVIMVMVTWVVGAAIYAPYFFIFKLFEVDSDVYCIATWEPAFEEPSTGKFYITLIWISGILIPFSLIASVYTIIVVVLLRKRNAMRGEVFGGIYRDKMHKNVLRMAVTIVVMFAICWAPLNINLFLSIFVSNSKNVWCNPHAFAFATGFLVYANTAFNPFVYFGFVGNYRRSLRNAIFGTFLPVRIREAVVRLIPKRRKGFQLTSIPCNEVRSAQVISLTKLHSKCESEDRVEREQHQSISTL
ncbi:growth hormone secretagogue receptor type 1-like [Stylophora pistillata]|uniref:growth hormone secretagogue receptor type 1-like n=1 Tax=Stylophora pistillata TaxID=50429 RepID=UPI000C04D2C0|nr:growth hormone secretagogue receptor type 1-like [Stylophora pistillata]